MYSYEIFVVREEIRMMWINLRWWLMSQLCRVRSRFWELLPVSNRSTSMTAGAWFLSCHAHHFLSDLSTRCRALPGRSHPGLRRAHSIHSKFTINHHPLRVTIKRLERAQEDYSISILDCRIFTGQMSGCSIVVGWSMRQGNRILRLLAGFQNFPFGRPGVELLEEKDEHAFCWPWFWHV